MKYAIIAAAGKQYKVSEGDVIEIAKIKGEKDEKISFDNVLLSVADGKIEIGNPSLKGFKVKATILNQKKGEKIRVSKFKAKVRERSVIGFRPLITEVKIDSIDGQKEDKKDLKKSS